MSSPYRHRLVRSVVRLWRPLQPSGGRPPSGPNLRDARSILVVKLDGMGDFVLATPFLRELRRLAPNARITLITLPAVSSLAETCAHVDEAVAYEPYLAPRRFGTLRRLRDIRRFVGERLGDRAFDLALLPRLHADLHQATLLAFLSGATRRVGFTEQVSAAKQSENAGYDRFLTNAVPGPAAVLPEPETNLELLRFLGGDPRPGPLELHATAQDETAVDAFLAAHGAQPQKPWLALGVGAADPDRMWPAENFLTLAREFSIRHGWQAFLFGGEQDRPRFGSSAGPQGGVVNCCGLLTLRQSYALLRRTRLFVGNDSGAMHLAAAAGRPCVMLCRAPPDFDRAAPESPLRFRPYGVPHHIVFAQGAPPAGSPSAAAVPFAAALAAAEDLAGIPRPG